MPPSPNAATAIADETFCQGCGYPLRGLPTPRCPECGRAFDPDDPKTMSLRHPLRPWQRRLLRPIGWPTASLGLLATIILACLSEWPNLRAAPPSILIAEFSRRPPPKFGKPPPFTLFDAFDYAAVLLWGVCLALILLRVTLRTALVPRLARRSEPEPRRARRSIACAALLSAVLLMFGWHHRIAQRWVAREGASVTVTMFRRWGSTITSDPPVPLTPNQTAYVLGHAVTDLPTVRERTIAVRLLVDATGHAAFDPLRAAFVREHDSSLRVTELHLLSLFRNRAMEPLFTAALSDPDPATRAAAADAIGILRKPAYSIEVPGDFWVIPPLSVEAPVPIDVRDIVGNSAMLPGDQMYMNGRHEQYDAAREAAIAVNTQLRDRLEAMMLHAPTGDEREAAARALVNWPPDAYRLRLAEWGVWIQSGRNLALAKSVIDEIPPFVHQTANPLSSFQGYFLAPSIVTKPIVHLTSDKVLAADVEVRIRQGRPWFAYPRPDDFSIATELTDGDTDAALADVELAAVEDLREGYPWLSPHHRAYRSTTNGFGGASVGGIFGLGLRWQSLIVTPAAPEGSSPPAVPGDPKYQWWPALRQVPSSYVTNRGETERFLYHDGPTRAPTPARVTLSDAGDALGLVQPMPTRDDPRDSRDSRQYRDTRRDDFHPLPPRSDAELPNYDGIYIRVTGGVPAAQRVTPDFAHAVHVAIPLPIQGEGDVVAEVRDMLTRYGLSAPEADGLIAAWGKQFFRTNGRRFLLRMSPRDYAQLCPLQVRPAPTELVRLGLVLTEFDAPIEPVGGDH